MALLARAPLTLLETAVAEWPSAIEARDVRPAEIGLVMVRGRMGGGGRPFNLGETSVTRATIRLADGTIGSAHILGRSRRHARLAAIFDALWQQSPGLVELRLLGTIRQLLAGDDAETRAETAATKVDFFTLVRGDN